MGCRDASCASSARRTSSSSRRPSSLRTSRSSVAIVAWNASRVARSCSTNCGLRVMRNARASFAFLMLRVCSFSASTSRTAARSMTSSFAATTRFSA
jgi:hypothetical protein